MCVAYCELVLLDPLAPVPVEVLDELVEVPFSMSPMVVVSCV